MTVSNRERAALAKCSVCVLLTSLGLKKKLITGFQDAFPTLNGYFCQLSVWLMLLLLCNKGERFQWKLLITCGSLNANDRIVSLLRDVYHQHTSLVP